MKTWDEYLEEAGHSIDLRAYWLQALDNFKESL